MTTKTQTAITGLSLPRLLLHGEGAVVLAGSIILFARLDLAWWWYPLLLLTPDLSAVGYLINPTRGAQVYNLFHTYSLPLLLGMVALLNGWTSGLGLALIWIGHIGIDRLFGYGLKYPAAFKDTHLGRV